MHKQTLLLAILVVAGLMVAGPASAQQATPPAAATQAGGQVYIVKAGDSLWSIAIAHRVTVADLLAANDLRNPSALSIGQRLRLPAGAVAPPSPTPVAAPAGPEAASEQAAPAAAAEPRYYVVQPGDTLWNIGVAHGVPVAALVAANDLANPAALSIGQRLLLPSGDEVVGSITRRYVVQAGDTLWGIASAHGVSLEQLLAANDLADPSRLAIGQTLQLPAGVEPVQGRAPGPAIAAPRVVQGPPADVADWPAYVLELMNAKRAAHGLPPLQWSHELAQAAQAHAEDCSQRNWCSHVGSDGARLRERMARAGYDADWASENWVLARGPQAGVDWWYNEPPGADAHRRNILHNQYTEVGVGVAPGQRGFYYIIANFGRR